MRRSRARSFSLALIVGSLAPGMVCPAGAANPDFVMTAPPLRAPAPEDEGGQGERQAAFDQVIVSYPREGRAGLLREVEACYGRAADLPAVRACYLLDVTARMVDAHVRIIGRQAAAPAASEEREAESAAVSKLRAIGVTPDRAAIKLWATRAGSQVTQQQREELFAMLHEG